MVVYACDNMLECAIVVGSLDFILFCVLFGWFLVQGVLVLSNSLLFVQSGVCAMQWERRKEKVLSAGVCS